MKYKDSPGVSPRFAWLCFHSFPSIRCPPSPSLCPVVVLPAWPNRFRGLAPLSQFARARHSLALPPILTLTLRPFVSATRAGGGNGLWFFRTKRCSFQPGFGLRRTVLLLNRRCAAPNGFPWQAPSDVGPLFPFLAGCIGSGQTPRWAKHVVFSSFFFILNFSQWKLLAKYRPKIDLHSNGQLRSHPTQHYIFFTLRSVVAAGRLPHGETTFKG